MTMPASPIPDKVPCYGCGTSYNPLDEQASYRHTHHAGAPSTNRALWPRRRGLAALRRRPPSGDLLAGYWLDRLADQLDHAQADRDAAIRAAASLEAELARYDHGVTRLLARRR